MSGKDKDEECREAMRERSGPQTRRGGEGTSLVHGPASPVPDESGIHSLYRQETSSCTAQSAQ